MSDNPKEFLRRAFNTGNYDVTISENEVIEFCQIFSGEPEARLAYEIASAILSKKSKSRCFKHLPR